MCGLMVHPSYICAQSHNPPITLTRVVSTVPRFNLGSPVLMLTCMISLSTYQASMWGLTGHPICFHSKHTVLLSTHHTYMHGHIMLTCVVVLFSYQACMHELIVYRENGFTLGESLVPTEVTKWQLFNSSFFLH